MRKGKNSRKENQIFVGWMDMDRYKWIEGRGEGGKNGGMVHI